MTICGSATARTLYRLTAASLFKITNDRLTSTDTRINRLAGPWLLLAAQCHTTTAQALDSGLSSLAESLNATDFVAVPPCTRSLPPPLPRMADGGIADCISVIGTRR